MNRLALGQRIAACSNDLNDLSTRKGVVIDLFGNRENVLLEIFVGGRHDHLRKHGIQRTEEIHGNISRG